jgi:hypothetical protein
MASQTHGITYRSINSLNRSFSTITAQAPQLPQTTAMPDYIPSTYVDPNIAQSDSQTWNVYGMSDRTINICEGFHCALNQAVSVRHPSVYCLIQVLRDIDAVSQLTMAQLALGAPPKN